MTDQKLFLLPCAVNNDFFLEQKSTLTPLREENRSALGIGQEEFVILFSARFTERKRPYDLIAAVAALEDPRLRIVFVGDGPEREGMEQAVRQLNVLATFTGFVGPEELAMYYSIADLDVVISSKDPSPKSLNEALIFSLPVVVTDVVGTAPDLVKDGKNGFMSRSEMFSKYRSEYGTSQIIPKYAKEWEKYPSKL